MVVIWMTTFMRRLFRSSIQLINNTSVTVFAIILTNFFTSIWFKNANKQLTVKDMNSVYIEILLDIFVQIFGISKSHFVLKKRIIWITILNCRFKIRIFDICYSENNCPKISNYCRQSFHEQFFLFFIVNYTNFREVFMMREYYCFDYKISIIIRRL